MAEQTWFTLDAGQSTHWQPNVERFGERFPKQAEKLRQAAQRLSKLQGFKLAPQKFAVRAVDDGALLYDPKNFDTGLRQNDERLRHLLKRGSELAVIAGSGLGYLANEALEDVRGDYRFGFLLAENRPELIAAQLCLFDCRSMIDSHQVFWLFDEAIQPAFDQFIEEQQLYLLHPSKLCVAPERSLSSIEQALFKQLPSRFAAVSQRYAPIQAEKRARYNQRMAQPPDLHQGCMWAVTLPAAYAHTPLMKALMSGFAQSAWKVRSVDVYDGFLTRHKVAAHLIESAPDVVMVCNAPSSTTVSAAIQRPRIVLMMDSPNHYAHNEFEAHLTSWDHIFYTDRTYGSHFQNLPAGSAQFYCTGPMITHRGKLRPEMKAPIAFVGQYLPVDWLTNKFTSKQKTEVLRAADLMVDSPTLRGSQALKEAGLSNPTLSVLAEQAQAYTGPMHREFPNNEAKVDYYLYTLANNLKRERIIKPLIPYGIALYGNPNWCYLLSNNRNQQYRGWLNVEALADAYASADLVLNIHSLQCPTSLNCRDFDVLAAGGCLLSDFVEDMNRGFLDAGRDFECFTALDSLLEKTERLINDPAYRHQLQTQGYHTYQNHHTPTHRAQFILSHLQAQKFGGSE